MTPRPSAPDPLEPLRSPQWLAEARRKAIHMCFLVLPLELQRAWLPWPRGRQQFALLFLVLTAGAMAIDVLRLNEQRVRDVFKRLLGELIRDHEQFGLLGSTYLLLASLLAIEIFPAPLAATALGFTVLGDAFGALVGRAWGRRRLFGGKTLEGTAGCLAGCLAWSAWVIANGGVPAPVVLTGAVVATLAELLPVPLDDNLAITLISGYAMKLLVAFAR